MAIYLRQMHTWVTAVWALGQVAVEEVEACWFAHRLVGKLTNNAVDGARLNRICLSIKV